MSQRGFTGVQKAAILIMQLGKDRAAKVLRQLREDWTAFVPLRVGRLGCADCDDRCAHLLAG